jgi:hypothetical protein
LDAVWLGRMFNPREVVEQITYLLFIKGLDDEQARALDRAPLLGQPVEGNPFPVGRHELRWSFIRHMHPDGTYEADRSPVEILDELDKIEDAIRAGMAQLRQMIVTSE